MATPAVDCDIKSSLKLVDQDETIMCSDRSNLFLSVDLKGESTREELAKSTYNSSTIIYCQKINQTKKVAEELHALGVKCGIYHSGALQSMLQKAIIERYGTTMKSRLLFFLANLIVTMIFFTFFFFSQFPGLQCLLLQVDYVSLSFVQLVSITV